MYKIIISMTCVLLMNFSSAFAKNSKFRDFKDLNITQSDEYNDIGYLQIVPQFEKNMDPNKAVTIEVFFGEYDGTEQSKRRLEYIKDVLNDEQRLNPNFKPEILALGRDVKNLKGSRDLQSFLGTLGYQDQKVKYEEIPSFIKDSVYRKRRLMPKRSPSSATSKKLLDGRRTWTLIRFSSIVAGSAASLYFIQGASAGLSAGVAIWPAIASAAVTYWSNAFGAFITSGKWATWLMESNNFFTRNLRKSLGINSLSFKDALLKNKDYFKSKYPTLYRKNASLFDADASVAARADVNAKTESLSKVLVRLRSAEEYLKWWVTEVAFTATVIKLPQALAGLSEVTGVMAMTSEVLVASTMGTLAQGAADIAVQVRKYQKIEELKQDVISGKVKVSTPKQLLAEIEMVLAKTGEHEHYLINDRSHPLLVKIENWSRARSTIISFFQVTGVAMEIAGIPLARPMLLGLGLSGAAYYGYVHGWIEPKKIREKLNGYFANIRKGKVPFGLQGIKTRMCTTPYMLKKQN